MDRAGRGDERPVVGSQPEQTQEESTPDISVDPSLTAGREAFGDVTDFGPREAPEVEETGDEGDA